MTRTTVACVVATALPRNEPTSATLTVLGEARTRRGAPARLAKMHEFVEGPEPASPPAGKVYPAGSGRWWRTRAYGSAYTFAVKRRHIAGLDELLDVLRELERDPHACVVRGAPLRSFPGLRVRRLVHDDPGGERATFGEDPELRLLCLDVDGVPPPPDWTPPVTGSAPSAKDLERLARHVRDEVLPHELRGVRGVWQWSGSAGVAPWTALRGHLWVFTDRPACNASLKWWLRAWPIDCALYNPVQPHYTAAPILTPAGALDPLGGAPRTLLLAGDRDFATLPVEVMTPLQEAECAAREAEGRRRDQAERERRSAAARARGQTDPEALGAGAIEGVVASIVARVTEAGPDGAHPALTRASFALGGLVGGGHLDRARAREALLAALVRQPRADDERTVDQMLERGAAAPWTPAPRGRATARQTGPGQPTPAEGEAEALAEPEPLAHYEPPAAPRTVSTDEAGALLRAELRTAYAAPAGTLTVLRGATGTGKSTAALAVAGEHATRTVYFAREHDLLDELEARARELGVATVKWPRLDDSTCPAGEVARITAMYRAGYDATAAICGRCRFHPSLGAEGGCPRLEAIEAFHTSPGVRLAPTAVARSRGVLLASPLEVRDELVPRGAILVFDEAPVEDLQLYVNLTAGDIGAYRALLAASGIDRDADPATLAVANLVDEVLGRALALLCAEPPKAGSARVVDLADGAQSFDPTDDELRKAAGAIDRTLARAVVDLADARRPRNLLPLALHVAVRAHRREPLCALRRADRLEIVIQPRPSPASPAIVLDATASPEALRAAFPGWRVDLGAPIALESPQGSRIVQYIDRSYARQALCTPEQLRACAGAAAAAVAACTAGIERPRLGVVSYKRVVAQLVELLVERLPDVEFVGALHFGGLRGKGDLEGVDVLLVVGTPRVAPAAVDLRALRVGAPPAALNGGRGAPELERLAYGGRVTRRYRTAGTAGAVAAAEDALIAEELLQAIGRQRRERHGGICIVMSAWPLPLPAGAVEVRSLEEDGAVVDPRSAAAIERIEDAIEAALAEAPAGAALCAVAGHAGLRERQTRVALAALGARHPKYEIDRSTRPLVVRRRPAGASGGADP